MTFFNEPWEHLVIDDFLPTEQFEKLKDFSYGIKVEDDFKGVTREFINYDPLNIEHLLEQFSNVKSYWGKLDKLIHFSVIKKSFMHEMHVDADFKIMTAILYLGPEKSMGTRIFDKDKNYVKEIEWKPNRLLVFCSSDDSWHDFGSYKNGRHTLNYFLIDANWHINNDTFRNNIIKNGDLHLS